MWFIDTVQNLIYKIVNYYSPEEKMTRDLYNSIKDTPSKKNETTQEESITELRDMVEGSPKMCYNICMNTDPKTKKYEYKNPAEANANLNKLAESFVDNLNKNVSDEQSKKSDVDYGLVSVNALKRARFDKKL